MDTVETWPRSPEAAAFFEHRLESFAAGNPVIADMATRFRDVAGVNLLNLVDHWTLAETSDLADELDTLGLRLVATEDGDPVWEHPAARLPRVRLVPDLETPRVTIGVENIRAFLTANRLETIDESGDRDSLYEEAVVSLTTGELGVAVRQGYKGFKGHPLFSVERMALQDARAMLRERPRHGSEQDVTAQAHAIFTRIAPKIGQARATDEFFAAERDYYMARNAAARHQYALQQLIGIGWANHDHHTYRSSRDSFQALLRLWDAMGFVMRERFYAGADAGWGAQVIEHPISRVVLFCDVDMAPEELGIDFIAEGLETRSDALGTIGLWCALHGSSIADAGMHHLECEFDFVKTRELFEAAGFPVMKPFTDLPMLKQAFTKPELWRVDDVRLQDLRERGLITPEQAATFAAQGAAGSHLEILQRWEGFKGFNKTGVSNIIRETDARRAVLAGAN
jgi:hypothetical protein